MIGFSTAKIRATEISGLRPFYSLEDGGGSSTSDFTMNQSLVQPVMEVIILDFLGFRLVA